MLETLRDFIETYYIYPITHDTGYNPVNTITWALVLVACLFLTFKLLKMLRIEINDRFIAAVSPYIMAGAILRVLEDAELVTPPLSYLFITPLIFFLVFGCCLALLILSVIPARFARLEGYDSTLVFALIGLLWSIGALTILLWTLPLVAPWVPFAVFGIAGGVVSALYLLGVKGGVQFLTARLNLAVVGAHLLDATSSVIGIDIFGYTGKHVLEGLIVNYTGTAVGMFPLKLGIILPMLYLLDSQVTGEERELKNLVLLALLVIGLAPAVRNTLRLMVGV
jgi:uncharacterized membrane protein